jgi:two-component system, chemotaxis family, sensor kinase CheA
MDPAERPFGHDAEFRGLFAEEAQARLDGLAESLLGLEGTAGHVEMVTAVLREAHTLKGGSAMVGLPRVTRLAHLLEDLLEPYRDGRTAISADLVDEALAAVDGLRAVIDAAGHEQDHEVEAAALEERLLRAAARAPAAVQAPAAPPETARAEVPPPAVAAPPRFEASTVAVPVARLDELVRLVTESSSALLRTGHLLAEATGKQPSTLTEFRDLARTLGQLQELTMRTRMVPVSTITHPLRRAVRDLARNLGREVAWEVSGEETEIDRHVLDRLADPLLHLVRNAVDHGIEGPDERAAAGKPRHGTVRLRAMRLGSEVILVIGDDGRGIDVEAVRAATDAGDEDDDETALAGIFRSGVSTARKVTDVSGRGVGLDVVRAQLEAIRGRVEVHNDPGRGCEFRLSVPITLAVVPCLVVRCGCRRYAVPAPAVLTVVIAGDPATLHAGGRPMVMSGGRAVPVTDLETILGSGEGGGQGPALVLSVQTRTHAVRVDALEGHRDVVLKSLGGLLPRLDVVAGATIEADGSVLVVLEPGALIERARRIHRPSAVTAAPSATAARQGVPVPPRSRRSVLVVDDALTVRELQRSILERAGYEVRTAADGLEALSRLAERPVDLVLTDVEMPRMDGFALTEAIRAHQPLRNTAVLVLSSRSGDDDRRRGLEAGADGYIVKSAFDQATLLNAVDRLLGGRG